MTENKNENKKRVVPVLTLEEFKRLKEKKNLPKGNFKICEEDAEEYIRLITK